MREPERWRVKVASRDSRAPVDGGCGRGRAHEIIVEGTICGAHHPAAHSRPAAAVPGAAEEFESSACAGFSRRACSRSSPHEDLMAGWKLDRSVQPAPGWHGGSTQGFAAAARIREPAPGALSRKSRNHPEQDGTSRLSPYLHFGHLGPLTVALAVQRSDAPARAKEAFLEQVIVQARAGHQFRALQSGL